MKERKKMVNASAKSQLSIRRQCELLEVNRNRLTVNEPVAWQPKPEHEPMVALALAVHPKDPAMGARRLREILKRNGYDPSRWLAGQIMEYAGLKAIYCKPRTTIPAAEHAKYPYLLRDKEVSESDQVWTTDITYIPWRKGHVYLAAVMDWHSRCVLGWQISNTMDVRLCLDAFVSALSYSQRAPKIFNTDQGSQFTGVEWLSAVESLGSAVSMDGKGRWMDNVLIERLWRSVKHEWVLLHEYNTLGELRDLVGQWMEGYNGWRPHASLGGQTPLQVYRGIDPQPDTPVAASMVAALRPPAFALPPSTQKAA